MPIHCAVCTVQPIVVTNSKVQFAEKQTSMKTHSTLSIFQVSPSRGCCSQTQRFTACKIILKD